MEEEANIQSDQSATSSTVRPSDVTAPDIKKPAKRGKSKLIRVILVVLVVALLGGGGWFLLKEPEFEKEEAETGSLVAPEITNTPTPTFEESEEPINRDGISVEILNGTGIAKEASYLQGKLASLDYSKIELGNTGKQDYETAVVTFSSSLDGRMVDEITEELENIYNDVTVKTSDNLDVDIQIITGLRAGQNLPTPEPTSEPTSTPISSPSATPSL